MKRRLLLPVLLLLALAPSARAAGPDLLGATLETSGSWVAVISKATIPTHIILSSEGDVTLAETTFDLQPNARRQVSYTGSGRGWVTARMTALKAQGSTGAVELRTWVLYTAPPPVPAGAPLWPLAVLVMALFVIFTIRRYRRDRS